MLYKEPGISWPQSSFLCQKLIQAPTSVSKVMYCLHSNKNYIKFLKSSSWRILFLKSTVCEEYLTVENKKHY